MEIMASGHHGLVDANNRIYDNCFANAQTIVHPVAPALSIKNHGLKVSVEKLYNPGSVRDTTLKMKFIISFYIRTSFFNYNYNISSNISASLLSALLKAAEQRNKV